VGEAWPVTVRYTRRALRELAAILDYIEAESPQGAQNVKRRLQAVAQVLVEHPRIGRVTNEEDVRRFVVSPYPYVIFYRPMPSGIVIHSIRHAARRPL
jgi:toxin ParE1/3/4